MAAPESPVPVDHRPAAILIPQPELAGRALQARVLNTAKLTSLPWDQFTTAAGSTELQENMDGLLRVISRSVNQPVPHVGVVLDLIEAGRLDEMAAPVFPEARHRLAQRGINVASAQHVQQRATADKAEIYGGIMNMVVDKERTDVLILSHGLLLVPGVPRLKMRTAKRRIGGWIESGDPRVLAADPANRFIPYEEIVAAPVTRKFPVKYEVRLHNGQQLEIRWGGETEEVGNSSELLGRALASATET